VGDLLILYAAESLQAADGDSPPSVSGYTLLNTTSTGGAVNGVNQGIYGRIATGSDNASVPAWASGQEAYAFIIDYASTSVVPSLASIVHNSNERTNSTESSLTYNALTITAANCLVIAVGQRGKTAATDSNTYAAIGSNGGNFNIGYQYNHGGSYYQLAYNDWIQTTATSIVQGSQTSTPASEGSAIGYDTQVIALLSNGTASGIQVYWMR
jgi:hypothetical protein